MNGSSYWDNKNNQHISALHTEYFLLQTLCLTYFSLDIPHLLMRDIMIIYCCLNILIHLINFVQKSKPLCELEKRGFLLNLELVQRYDFSMKQHQKI